MNTEFNARYLAGKTITIDVTSAGSVVVAHEREAVFKTCAGFTIQGPRFGSMTHRVKLTDTCTTLFINVTSDDIVVVEKPSELWKCDVRHPSYRDVLNKGARKFAEDWFLNLDNDILDLVRAALEHGK